MELTLFPNSVIKLPQSSTSLNPSRSALQIHCNGSEIEHVDENEGRRGNRGIGEALEIMAAASDSYVKSGGFGANESELEMGFV